MARVVNDGSLNLISTSVTGYASEAIDIYIYAKDTNAMAGVTNPTFLYAWYITL